ncbi:hypothetical protein Fmac_008198 [Flemingia macrophylla]|uniref:Uncharacterized protein n=1 Tax=Flemingia macrophylla TaxID=520843 RepID=A0ABD1MWR4_9FABA
MVNLPRRWSPAVVIFFFDESPTTPLVFFSDDCPTIYYLLRRADRVNQDHDQNAEDEDQPMLEEHVADIGPQPTLQYDPQMLSQIWSDIQGLQEGLNNLTINVNSSIHGLQEGLTTLTTDVNRGFNTLHTRFDNLEKRFDDFQQSSE